MPLQYERIKASFLERGNSLKEAKKHAAMTFIARGKGGNRSSRAKSLHEGAKIDYSKRKQR
jgi:hypothetical protein